MKKIGDILKMTGGGTVTGRFSSGALYHETVKGRQSLDPEMLVPPLKKSDLEALAARDQMTRRIENTFRAPMIDFAKVEARLMSLFGDALREILREEREALADRDEATCGAFMAAVKYGGHDLTDNNT